MVIYSFITWYYFSKIKISSQRLILYFIPFIAIVIIDLSITYINGAFLNILTEIGFIRIMLPKPRLLFLGDANWAAFIAAFFYAIFRYIRENKLLAIICGIIIFLSLSRITIFIILLDLLLIDRFQLKDVLPFSYIKSAFIIIIFMLIALPLGYYFIDISKITDQSLLTRVIDTKRSIAAFMDSFLLGNPISGGQKIFLYDYRLGLSSTGYRFSSAHINVFLPDVLNHQGVIGLSFILLLFWYQIKRFWLTHKNIKVFLLLGLLIIFGFNLHGIFYKNFFWILFGLMSNPNISLNADKDTLAEKREIVISNNNLALDGPMPPFRSL
jgi:hypothetical protein